MNFTRIIVLSYNGIMTNNPSISPLSSIFYWVAPLSFLAGIAYFTPEIDLQLSEYFYNAADNTFSTNYAYDIIRVWGVAPAMLTAVSASVFLGLSYFIKRLKPWRNHALMLILPMVLGAGFITHTLLKDHWGRPRPRQVENFGGENSFRPFYKPNLSWEVQPYKSFPCGHCSMGFYFFALTLLGRRMRSKPIFFSGLFITIVLGAALSLARIAQGGHFFSDTVVTAIVMWLTALACERLVFESEERLYKSVT